jgi:iron complex outermembrane recepter protein
MRLIGPALLGILLCSPFAAGASEDNSPQGPSASSASSGQLEEITVTAQKRSERELDVPLSISAVSGDALERQGITSVADLEKIVPGFTYQPSQYGTPIYSIRGIGFYEDSVAVAPTVSVYVDQVPLPYSAMTLGAGFDLQRVEVLKGPQGTLFGQNSTGGAINYIAAKPTSDPEAALDVTYGRFNEVDLESFVSGPVAPTLSGRLAVRVEERGDWQESETRDATLGSRDFKTARLLLDWNPNDALEVELNANGWTNNSDTQAAQFVLYAPIATTYPPPAGLPTYPVPGHDDRLADWDPNRSFARADSFAQMSLHVDWDIANFAKLTSISSFSELRSHNPTDADGTAIDNLFLNMMGNIQSATQELRLAGQSLENRLKWMVGGNFERDLTKDDQEGIFTSTNSGVGPDRYTDFINSNNQSIQTEAAFTSLEYQITDSLSAQGSVRYTNQNNLFNGCLRDTGDGELARAFSLLASSPIAPGACVTLEPPPSLAAVPIVTKRLDEDNVSWRAGLSWKPAEDTMVYGNVTKGFKAGSFPTVPGLFPNQFDPIPQESVLAYEMGAKSYILDRKIEASGAIFYYDYDDKQILGYIPTAFGNLPGLVSIPKSKVRGAETDITARPWSGLAFTVGATYVDSSVSTDFFTNDPFSHLIDIKGEQFPNTPRWQFTVSPEYTMPLNGRLNAFVGATGHYRTTSVAAFGNSPYFQMPAYGTLDVRTGLESSDGKWTVELWGRNVTNQYYLLSVVHPVDTISQLTGMPATFGITVRHKF